MTQIKMHPKIIEARQKAGPIEYSSIVITTQGKLSAPDLDKGIVKGYAIIWGDRSMSGYKFVKGCCARSIAEHGPGSNAFYEIKFLNQHNDDDPLSLFTSITEDNIGLAFETKPLDFWDVPGSSAHRLIQQLKSGTINNFSHGYNWIWEKVEYDDTDDSLVGTEIQLFEISPVSIPAGLNTRQIQSLENLGDVKEDIEQFIRTLPSKYKMEARQLFALQHSYINIDALKQHKAVEQKIEKVIKGIDYDFLSKNW